MHAALALSLLAGAVQPRPRPSALGRREASLGSVLGALASLPRSASADGAESRLSQQTARTRYGPRLLRLRERIEVRSRANVDAAVTQEANAVHLFASGAFPRGSEKAKLLLAREGDLLAAAKANDATLARQALDDMIEVGELRYTASTPAAATTSAGTTPAARAPRPSSADGFHLSSVVLVLLSSAILALTLLPRAMSSVVGMRASDVLPPPPKPPLKPLPPRKLASGAAGGGEAADGTARVAAAGDGAPMLAPASMEAAQAGGAQRAAPALLPQGSAQPADAPMSAWPAQADALNDGEEDEGSAKAAPSSPSSPSFHGVVERSRKTNVQAPHAAPVGPDGADDPREGDRLLAAEPQVPAGISPSVLQLLDLDH